MGDRYWLTVKCPCGIEHEDVYYAPTCGITTFKCYRCHTVLDLEAITGISAEDASNRKLIEDLVRHVAQRVREERAWTARPVYSLRVAFWDMHWRTESCLRMVKCFFVGHDEVDAVDYPHYHPPYCAYCDARNPADRITLPGLLYRIYEKLEELLERLRWRVRNWGCSARCWFAGHDFCSPGGWEPIYCKRCGREYPYTYTATLPVLLHRVYGWLVRRNWKWFDVLDEWLCECLGHRLPEWWYY